MRITAPKSYAADKPRLFQIDAGVRSAIFSEQAAVGLQGRLTRPPDGAVFAAKERAQGRDRPGSGGSWREARPCRDDRSGLQRRRPTYRAAVVPLGLPVVARRRSVEPLGTRFERDRAHGDLRQALCWRRRENLGPAPALPVGYAATAKDPVWMARTAGRFRNAVASGELRDRPPSAHHGA